MPQVLNLNQSLIFGAPSSPFGAETSVVSTTTGQTHVLALGVWMVKLDAEHDLEYSPDAGSNWKKIVIGSATVVGVPAVYSDGFNLRLIATAANPTSLITKVKALY